MSVLKQKKMKNLTAKNQNLTLEENIFSVLKREFSYAEPVIPGEQYTVGTNHRGLKISFDRNVNCDYSIAIETREGRCWGQFV